MKETEPARYCDIVMKGGITSGVVYPLAIVELAEEFRFKNIGGTSAGAIASALVAAAEYQRVSNGSADGFRRLEQLPEFLGGSTGDKPNLLNLFPPTRSTRRLFTFATAFLSEKSNVRKAVTGLYRVLFVSPLITLLSFLPSVVAIALIFFEIEKLSPASTSTLIVLSIALVVFGFLILSMMTIFKALCFSLPRNGFGFSTGLAASGNKLPGVTDWLHSELQATAGRSLSDRPLSFGDLWTAGADEHDSPLLRVRCDDDSDARSINLQMITTGLSHGRPYRLPFEESRFLFREGEFRALFPREVVDHLLLTGRKVESTGHTDLYALPAAADLPVLVAARMSLSFPLLFTLVPLYAIDYTLPAENDAARSYERCWFIDGGLSSNFPLHLFDVPFPRWPTFGINLGTPTSTYPIDDDEERNVWMVAGNAAGRANRWLRFPPSGLAAFTGYLAAILDTIRNWRDNTQMGVPGFLDRVVHVNLDAGEGGLNLSMSRERIARLARRGRCAGKGLRARFGKDGAKSEPLNWNSHRWVRYKTSMALLQKVMHQMHESFREPDADYPSYRALVARTEDAEPKTGYWWKRDRVWFQHVTDDYLEFAETLRSNSVDFDGEAPRPKPELRISPRL